MFGHEFYNETIKKYVAVFGTMFNDIVISREGERFKVPIAYGPAQKFISRVEQDPDFNQKSAITLPRISFEVVGMSYDARRKLPALSPGTPSSPDFSKRFSPAPYNIEFELTVMTRYNEDGMKVIEQIIPFFTPHWSSTVKLMEEIDDTFDVDVVLNSVSNEDNYEGSFEDRRIMTWTLNFTMKAQFFGPVTNRKVIKFAKADVHNTMNTNSEPLETVTVQPGQTANGEPTTDETETIPYMDIEEGSDWDYIVRIEDEDDG